MSNQCEPTSILVPPKVSVIAKMNAFFHRLKIHFIFANRRHPALLYLWCFLIPACLMTFMHAVIGVFPFGEMSVLTLDLNAQYVFFFEALREWVWGDNSILYSFARSLGGEFVGIYAYYLASPLSYIVVLFPRAWITEALYLMFVIKCGLCGLTFGFFLRNKDKTKPLWTILFSTMYALIGYATIMQHNTMWFDNMYLLPLIVLGLYELMLHKRYKLYTICLAVAILSNFYIGYMTCIFILIYSFFLYFSLSPQRRNPKGEKAHFLRAFMRIGLFSIIAVLIACLIILPAYYALSFGKTEFSKPDYSLSSRFALVDIFKQFLFCSYDTVRPEGLPIVYCGILTLMAIPLYMACKRIRIRERLCHFLFALVLLCGMSVNTIDMIWHGFQAPNWLNYRYSFMLCFILVYMAARSISHLYAIPRKTIVYIATSLILLIALVTYQQYKMVLDTFTTLFSVAFILAYTVLLYKLLSVPTQKKVRKHLKIILVMVVCIELTLNGIYDLIQLWYDVGMSSRASYTDYLKEWRPIIAEVQDEDTDFYRMEKLPYRRMNDPSALYFRGVTASTSTLHADTIAFLEYMGISADSHWSEYAGSSPVTDSVLGIRYVMDYTGNTRVSRTYTLYKTDGSHDIYLNSNALPIAFCVSNQLNQLSFTPQDYQNPDERKHIDDVYSVFERMNILLGTMLGIEKVEVYQPLTGFTMEEDSNLSSYGTGYHKRYYIRGFQEGDQATLTITIPESNGKEVYAHFPSQHMRDGTSLTINGGASTPWFNNSYYGTLYVGEIDEGTKGTMSITVAGEDGFYMAKEDEVESYFYMLDESLYQSVFETLKEGGFSISSYTESSFEGTINVPEYRTTVMTTLPYDQGWKITVDGKAIETYETLDALLAFDLTPGTHSINMTYKPDIYPTALKLCLVGCGMLAFIMAAEFVYRKHFQK